MANHGYIKTNQELSFMEIDKLAKEVNEKYFKNILEYSSSDAHSLFLLDDHNAIQYWISDQYKFGENDSDGNWFEYDEPKIISKNSVVEFRHGFGYSFMWWVESIFMHYIAEKVSGVISDDGYEIKPNPNLTKFLNSYEEYIQKSLTLSKLSRKLYLKGLKSDFKYFKKQTDEQGKKTYKFINECCYNNQTKI